MTTESLFVLPRSVLRLDNTVLTVTKDNTLHINEVDIARTTAKEVLRFYLPGMWSFRQFGGNTVSRVRSGNLQGTPAQWVEHFRSDPDTSPGVETLGRMNGSELSRIPESCHVGETGGSTASSS